MLNFIKIINLKLITLIIITSLNLFISNQLSASVLMTGSRIIYSESSKEQIIQFDNPDNSPYMMQIWTDIDNPQSTPESADGPFVAIPQIFRIQPQQGQVVRLVFAGMDNIAKDRESVFYFNFLQIPSLKQDESGKNKLALLISSRVKIFYRPNGLRESSDKVADHLSFTLRGDLLEVNNTSSYFASFKTIQLVDDKNNVLASVSSPTMANPKSKQKWQLSASVKNNNKIVKYELINDYGVPITHEYKLNSN